MKNFWRVLAYLKHYKPQAWSNMLFNVLAVVFGTLSLLVLKPFLDILFSNFEWQALADDANMLDRWLHQFNTFLFEQMRDQGKEAGLTVVCLVVVVLFFLKNLFRYLALFVMAPVRNGIERDIREQLFGKMLSLQLAYFSEQRKGDLLARLTADVQEIQWSVLRGIEVIVRSPVEILLSLGLMLYISPILTGFSFGLGLFVALIIGRVGKSLRKQSTDAQQSLGRLLSIFEEALGGLRIIMGFNAERYQYGRFQKENKYYFDLRNQMQRRQDLASPMTEFLGIAVVCLLLWFGGRLVFSGNFDASTFVVFVMLFYNIITPAKSFSKAFYDIQKGISAAERVNEIVDAELNIKDSPNAKPLHSFDEAIVFKEVRFHYQSNELVLKGINLRIEKGKTIALVGASGAGKSTIADLIPRFYDISQGAIELDGRDIREYRLKDLRALMGIVSQEAILFNDSIYNNIVFGLEDVTKEEVEAAARIANAHDFIIQLEKGYATNIGDRGAKLSGGQRQRVTIARAILRNPPILILDEATSALDSKSERLVQDALTRVLQNRTAVVIAHRLSTIQFADEIVVMHEGEIVERGTHEMLLADGGAYQKLVNLQQM